MTDNQPEKWKVNIKMDNEREKELFADIIDYAQNYGSLKIEYDQDYGSEKRTGWSIVIDGSVVAELVPTLQEAFEIAQQAVLEWEYD